MKKEIYIFDRWNLNTCILNFLISEKTDQESIDKLVDLVKNESYRLGLPNIIKSLKDYGFLIEKDSKND